MRFVADESIDRQIVDKIREDYEVLYIAEDFSGLDDESVLKKTNDFKSVLLTADKDFGELIFNKNMNAYGVVLIRLHGIKPEEKAEMTFKTIEAHKEEIERSFTIITKNHIRIRKLN